MILDYPAVPGKIEFQNILKLSCPSSEQTQLNETTNPLLFRFVKSPCIFGGKTAPKPKMVQPVTGAMAV